MEARPLIRYQRDQERGLAPNRQGEIPSPFLLLTKNIMSNTGLIEDPRTPDQKAKDYQHSELASGVVTRWVEKDPSQWKKYSLRDQDGQYSCVANACAKAFEVDTGIVASSHNIYRSRFNYPNGGMWLANAGDICRKTGTTSEQADPSNGLNEAQINLPITKPSTVKSGIYVMITIFKDIESIAQSIEMAKSAPITVNGFVSEWGDKPVFNGKTIGMDLQHAVDAVDYFLYQGIKYILIDDSWGHATTIGNGGQRLITAEYLQARCSAGMYLLNVSPTDQKPHHTFSKYLTFGMVNDPDVKALQQILAYEGLFPIAVTGNYGNITAGAVYKWQIKHNVASLIELNTLYGKRCGPKTIAKLNEIYQ